MILFCFMGWGAVTEVPTESSAVNDVNMLR